MIRQKTKQKKQQQKNPLKFETHLKRTFSIFFNHTRNCTFFSLLQKQLNGYNKIWKVHKVFKSANMILKPYTL